MSIAVVLQSADNNTNIPNEAQFQSWVDAALSVSEYLPAATCEEVCITIVDKAESAQLNTDYRQKTGPTNVLAFTYDPVPGFEADSLGDLAICAQVVEEEAQTQEKPLQAHWAHLTIHGVLHLLGYDHIDPNEAVHMERLEIKALQSIGFPNPYD